MPGSTVRSNAVHNSLQRGYVFHGTHQLTAQDNVAFNTTGHTFMFEDGIEMNNTLTHNLVITSNPATVSHRLLTVAIADAVSPGLVHVWRLAMAKRKFPKKPLE